MSTPPDSSDRPATAPLRVGIVVAGSLLILALVGLLAWGQANRSSVTGLSGFTRVGRPAPEIEIELLDGSRFSLSEGRGRVVVLNFWASTCPPCRVEARAIESAWRSYSAVGVLFLGVNIQDARESAQRFVEEFGLTYPSGLDPGGRVAIDYGVVGIPVTFVIDGDGVVARRWVGEIDGATLAAWVDELLAGGEPVEEPEGVNQESYYTLDEL